MVYTSRHSCVSCTKIQDTHDPAIFRSRIQLQLITLAMTFAETSAGSFLARAINFHFAFLSGMGGRFRQRVAFLREMGIDLKNAAAKLQLATRPLPVCPRALHRVIPLVSHSGGSTPRAFLSPSRSSKRALFHCPRNIFTTTRAICSRFRFLFPPFFPVIDSLTRCEERNRAANEMGKVVEDNSERFS